MLKTSVLEEDGRAAQETGCTVFWRFEIRGGHVEYESGIGWRIPIENLDRFGVASKVGMR